MKKLEIEFFMGIDVQIRRDCPFAILDNEGICISSGWLKGNTYDEICQDSISTINDFEKKANASLAIGIDSPRIPLSSPRKYYWVGNKGDWRKRRSRDKGYGRHCEVILKGLNLANPQWTPMKGDCPEWMQLGFSLFDCLKNREEVFEVFPTASYSILKGRSTPKVTIDFSNFIPGPKDMIDACVSAITVLEFMERRGCELGGGDGLGKIILPGKLGISDTHPILKWPN